MHHFPLRANIDLVVTFEPQHQSIWHLSGKREGAALKMTFEFTMTSISDSKPGVNDMQ